MSGAGGSATSAAPALAATSSTNEKKVNRRGRGIGNLGAFNGLHETTTNPVPAAGAYRCGVYRIASVRAYRLRPGMRQGAGSPAPRQTRHSGAWIRRSGLRSRHDGADFRRVGRRQVVSEQGAQLSVGPAVISEWPSALAIDRRALPFDRHSSSRG
ncbi:hypothetical protein LBMAG47_30000 [Planctomycetia bacterium]|nr:hypothetical protein LBMAG47_30000 [Planctomycetia bacterium]